MALPVAWFAAANAGANALAKGAPDVALRFAPANPTALAFRADKTFLADPTHAAGRAARDAALSMRDQPLNPRALRVLGFVADARHQPAKAAQLINLSARMSRRDVGAQLWLIEDAVAHGSVADALLHYDVALSTAPSSTDLLFATLTAALDVREVRQGFLPYLARGRPWTEAFLAFAIAHAAHPEAIAQLALRSPRFLADPHNDEMGQRLVERLIAGGKGEDARRVYLSVPGHSVGRLESPAFGPRDQTASDGAVGWRMVDNPAGSAVLDQVGVGARLAMHVQVTADSTAALATRTLFLRPGNYVLGATIANAAVGPSGSLRIRLSCLRPTGGGVLWTRETNAAGRMVIYFIVDQNCLLQSLTVEMTGGDAAQDASADIMDMQVVRH